MSAKAVTALCNDAFAPIKVHVIPGLLEKIAELALDGHAAASHGGLEIGGLLFGRRDSGFVTVEDIRTLACDHSLGPRFILSDSDERGLRDLLGAPANDPALEGLCIVGWYCSHTRSDLLLLDRELVLHDTYFAGADNFVIILKPRDLRNVTAAIFLRGANGAIDPNCPATILELRELRITRQPTRAGTSKSCDLSTFSSHTAPPSVNEHALTLPHRSRAIASAAADRPLDKSIAVLANAAAQSCKTSRRSAKWKILLAAAGVIALLSLGVWQYLQVTQVHPASLFLSLRPHAGKLLLSWNSNLVKPQRAHIDIFDATSSEHVNITEIFQPSGVLLFTHNTGNVQAVLTVETGNGVVVRHASFADPSVDPALSDKNLQSAPPTNFSPLNSSGISTPGMNPATQQLASKITSKQTRRRHSRRTHHKKTSASSTPLQPGNRVNPSQR
jgi:hypothetical protein